MAVGARRSLRLRSWNEGRRREGETDTEGFSALTLEKRLNSTAVEMTAVPS
jgi:hypothetical protein